MERASTRKGLKVEHYSEKIEQAKVFIRKRMNNEAPSLKTSFKKLNDALFEGFEWNRIVTIAGLSASGKSLLLSQIRRDVVDYNPNEKLNILAFEMEMLGVDQVSRDISSKTDLTTRELYSAGSKLTEQQYDTVCKTADKMKYYPIFIVDDVGTVDEIVHTILNFVEENKLIEENRGLICTFDHSLLVKGTVGEDQEKLIIDKLYKTLIQLKKYFEIIKLKSLFIVLSQLNRSIEEPQRITNPMLHYPTKNDLFASSAAFYCSDYVIITHKPAGIEGLGSYYGPSRGEDYPYGLPVFNPKDPQRAMIYWHIIKARFSSSQILMMVENFKHSKIEEY